MSFLVVISRSLALKVFIISWRKKRDKTDITNYVKLKLGLVQSEEPRPSSPEDPEPESQSV